MTASIGVQVRFEVLVGNVQMIDLSGIGFSP